MSPKRGGSRKGTREPEGVAGGGEALKKEAEEREMSERLKPRRIVDIPGWAEEAAAEAASAPAEAPAQAALSPSPRRRPCLRRQAGPAGRGPRGHTRRGKRDTDVDLRGSHGGDGGDGGHLQQPAAEPPRAQSRRPGGPPHARLRNRPLITSRFDWRPRVKGGRGRAKRCPGLGPPGHRFVSRDMKFEKTNPDTRVEKAVTTVHCWMIGFLILPT